MDNKELGDYMNITNQTYRLATEDFILHQPVDDFVFEGAVGFNALIDFMSGGSK